MAQTRNTLIESPDTLIELPNTVCVWRLNERVWQLDKRVWQLDKRVWQLDERVWLPDFRVRETAGRVCGASQPIRPTLHNAAPIFTRFRCRAWSASRPNAYKARLRA